MYNHLLSSAAVLSLGLLLAGSGNNLATATASNPSVNASYLFSNNPELLSSSSSSSSSSGLRIPSIYESTLQARRIAYLSKIGTISTIFPRSSSSSSSFSSSREQQQQLPLHTEENRPHSVAGAPIGQMEYFASCGPEDYNPTLLGVSITTTMKNAAAGSNVTLSLRYHLPDTAPPVGDPWAYLPANLPRIALVGYIEHLDDETIQKFGVRDCFVERHPEATIWEPGSDLHESWWGRLVVDEVYFFGGFGDRARIGWMPVELWRSITTSEVEAYRLIGEEGYRVDQLGEGDGDGGSS